VSKLTKKKTTRPFHCYSKVLLTYAACTHARNQPSLQENCVEFHGNLKSNHCLPAHNLHLTLSTWITLSEHTFRITLSEQSFGVKCSLRQHRITCSYLENNQLDSAWRLSLCGGR